MYHFFESPPRAYDGATAMVMSALARAASSNIEGNRTALLPIVFASDYQVTALGNATIPRYVTWNFPDGVLIAVGGTGDFSDLFGPSAFQEPSAVAGLPGKVFPWFSGFGATINTIITLLGPSIVDKWFVLTGHGMAGAVAYLWARALKNAGADVRLLYTFGAPRVGDQTFVTQSVLNAIRVMRAGDPVPQLPPRSYRPIGAATWAASAPIAYNHQGQFVLLKPDGTIDYSYIAADGCLKELNPANWTAIRAPESTEFHKLKNYASDIEKSLTPRSAQLVSSIRDWHRDFIED